MPFHCASSEPFAQSKASRRPPCGLEAIAASMFASCSVIVEAPSQATQITYPDDAKRARSSPATRSPDIPQLNELHPPSTTPFNQFQASASTPAGCWTVRGASFVVMVTSEPSNED